MSHSRPISATCLLVLSQGRRPPSQERLPVQMGPRLAGTQPMRREAFRRGCQENKSASEDTFLLLLRTFRRMPDQPRVNSRILRVAAVPLTERQETENRRTLSQA